MKPENDMTTDQRDEALRLAKEAGFEAASPLWLWKCEKLIALARASAAPQEPVAFDHSIGDGRFRPVKSSFWWQIEIGDGTARYGKFHSKLAAEDMCLRLLCAYRDGAFAQHLAAAPKPQASPQEPDWMSPWPADESLALAEKIMGRVVATGSAYLKLELVDPTAPQPQAPSSDDVREAELLALKMADRLCKEALPKFNWGASALDANAIKLLNEVPGLISAAIQGAGEK